MFTVALAHLIQNGLRLEPHEAVAIVQAAAAAPAGLPVLENIEVSSDGSVAFITRKGVPAVADFARLLQRLLPDDAAGTPPLRYAIARGLGEVEAPPFASIDAWSTTLRRFEAGERADVIKGALQRAARSPRVARPEPVQPVAVPHVPAAAGDARFAEPAYDMPLHDAAVEIPPRRRLGGLVVVTALLVSALVGFATMLTLDDRQAEDSAVSSGPDAPVAPPDRPMASPDRPAAPLDRAAASPDRPVATDGRTAALPGRASPATLQDAGPVRALRGLEGPAFSPAFASNGSAMFFQTGDRRDPRSAIAMASGSLDGDLRIVKIVDDGSRNYHAQPSPDGRAIAFDSDRDGERGVYVADRTGAGAHRVSGPGYAAVPTWSPDGTRIAYIRAEPDRPSVWNLWIQPATGGRARRVTEYPSGQTWSASWFPDNRRICYTHETTLTILDLVTGESRQFDSPVTGSLMRTPAVSPDGSRVVFQVFHRGAWILTVDDGAMTPVLEDPTAEEFAWAPDGRRIAFHSKRNGRWGIYLLSRG